MPYTTRRTSLRLGASQVTRRIHDLIDRVETTLTERINRLEMDLRERLARVEGLFEGIRDSILGRTKTGTP